MPELKSLPIIAVTAKAMKGDREKCIEAGAWDYLSKPVDPEQMLAVLSAENGRAAIEVLQSTPDVDVVLMDIMMPGMDGYETMRAIRKMAKFRHLPIVAVTAKAMKGDREKCIEAGAWDYLSKPVDTERMLSVLRGWLRR